MSQIPLVDVKAQFAPLIPELERRFREVLEECQFVRGPNYWAFQEEAASYLGVTKAVGVANGTDAIVLALDALEIGPGDEVVCPAFTFYATAESIARRGATPVFADIDPATFNLDPEDVAAKITPRTRAIMPVHLFGRPAPMAELAELGVPMVEDAAQAFGAPGVATTGVLSTYSFFPTKNLFCLGDGGLVASNDEELGEHIDVPQDEPGHIYHLFVSRSPERDCIRAALTEAGIASAVYYTTPLHLQPALRFLGYEPGSLPETERVAEDNFSVPLWPGIPVDVQERVVDVVRTAVVAVARA
ncbi:MAG: DegT/DnrJ/EryC1/StrS family aminotransferase [Gaiellaceae bacterium]